MGSPAVSVLLWPRRTAPFVAILALTLRAGAAQIVQTNDAPQAPRTAMIVGQVVDGTTGRPVPEAIVRLTMPSRVVPDLRLPPDSQAPGGRVMADEEGRFFFSDLPAGEYYLQATKDGYAFGTYRQRRPSGRGELLPLHEGERRIDVALPVWEYGVIGGRVVDEAGEPVVGVAVRALVRRSVAGRPQYGNQSWLVPSATTDDRGMFRLSRIEPGTYVVVAPSMHTTVPVSIMTGMDAAALRRELFYGGVFEVSALGQPRTQQVGDFALMTLNSVLIPPAAHAPGRMAVYRTTYYPAAASAAAATPIRIDAGEERDDVAIALRPVHAARVSGRLVAPDGSAPPPMAIRLVGDARRDVVTPSLPNGPADVGFETATAVSDTSGRFTFLGVPPGEYVLEHANPFLADAVQQGRTTYWISQAVTVGDDDLHDLAVDARAPLRIEGRMEFHGAGGPQPVPAAFANAAVTFEAASGGPMQFFVRAAKGAALSFSTVAAGGRYIARPLESGEWVVESITLDGKDITDRAFDLQTDATSFVITYTDRRSKLTGTVKDTGGNARQNAAVLVFPVDRQWWSDHGANPRRLKSTFTAQDGAFVFAHLPPGSYCVIAVDEAEADGWMDPKTLEALASRATKLTITAGDAPKTLDLTLRAIR